MERKLYRSRSDRMISGVCGGLADYLQFDPTLVRVIVVLLAAVTQGGVLVAYLIMTVVVPEEPLEGPGAAAPAAMPVATEDQGGIAMSDTDNQVAGTDASDTAGIGTSPVAPQAAMPSGAQTAWTPAPAPVPEKARRRGRGVGFGVALVLIGLLLLVNEFVPGVDLWRFWPLIIVAIGLSAVFKGVRR